LTVHNPEEEAAGKQEGESDFAPEHRAPRTPPASESKTQWKENA